MIDNNQEYLFELYRQVQANDKAAINKLVSLHKEKFPNHHFRQFDQEHVLSQNFKQDLHTMYIHLTR